MADVYESITYKNASGKIVHIADKNNSKWLDIGRREGFEAPEIELFTQKYVNGATKIIGRVMEPRTIKIRLILIGKSTAERDALFHNLVKDLIDIDGGEKGEMTIKRSDGTEVTLYCSYVSGLNVVDEYRRFHRFTLEFMAEDPYFYGQKIARRVGTTASDILTLAEDLYLGVWYLGIGNIEGRGVVNNPLDIDSDPVITIPGQRLHITITNVTTGQVLRFTNLGMNLGESLVIDTRPSQKEAYIVQVNGKTRSVSNRMDWSNTNMEMKLIPGDNVIEWTSYGEGDVLTMNIQERYLSA